jgi:hypothetical protein
MNHVSPHDMFPIEIPNISFDVVGKFWEFIENFGLYVMAMMFLIFVVRTITWAAGLYARLVRAYRIFGLSPAMLTAFMPSVMDLLLTITGLRAFKLDRRRRSPMDAEEGRADFEEDADRLLPEPSAPEQEAAGRVGWLRSYGRRPYRKPRSMLEEMRVLPADQENQLLERQIANPDVLVAIDIEAGQSQADKREDKK